LPNQKLTAYLSFSIGNWHSAIGNELDGRPAPVVASKEATWAFSAESSNFDLGDAVTGVAGHVSNSLHRKHFVLRLAFSLRPIWHRVLWTGAGRPSNLGISDCGFRNADFET